MPDQRFSSFADVNRWLDTLDPDGTIVVDGTFTAGQTLSHCAQSVEMQVAGYPKMKPTIVRQTVGRLARTVFLRTGNLSHSTDAPIPGAPEIEPVSTAEGIDRLRSAMASFIASGEVISEHFMYGAVDASSAERLQSMHIANHANSFGPTL